MPVIPKYRQYNLTYHQFAWCRPRQVQGADPGQDPPDTGDQPDTIGRRSHAIPSRMARILWLLPDPKGAYQPGGMDPPKATFVSLAAMAKRPQPFQGTAAPWRAEVPRGGCRWLADRVLAHVRTSGGPTGPAQPVFRRPRYSPTLCCCSSLTRSNRRGTDPYARWCGRGGAARCPPIPIIGAKPPSDAQLEDNRVSNPTGPFIGRTSNNGVGGKEGSIWPSSRVLKKARFGKNGHATGSASEFGSRHINGLQACVSRGMA